MVTSVASGGSIVSLRLVPLVNTVAMSTSRSPSGCGHDNNTLVLLLWSTVRLETAAGARRRFRNKIYFLQYFLYFLPVSSFFFFSPYLSEPPSSGCSAAHRPPSPWLRCKVVQASGQGVCAASPCSLTSRSSADLQTQVKGHMTVLIEFYFTFYFGVSYLMNVVLQHRKCSNFLSK